jgi:hypothetical protein
MCFVPVENQPETYRHVKKPFVTTIQADQAKIDQLAQALGIQLHQFKPGKIIIVNDA